MIYDSIFPLRFPIATIPFYFIRAESHLHYIRSRYYATRYQWWLCVPRRISIKLASVIETILFPSTLSMNIMTKYLWKYCDIEKLVTGQKIFLSSSTKRLSVNFVYFNHDYSLITSISEKYDRGVFFLLQRRKRRMKIKFLNELEAKK